MANWIEVCNESDIDTDDLIRFDYKNLTFCIYHLSDGFYATDGICTHEAVHLEDGYIEDGMIECPMHQGVFEIKTGKAKMLPACKNLKTYQVKVENEKIYINLDQI